MDITKFIEQKTKVRIERKSSPNYLESCYILYANDQLVLTKCFYDFREEGYKIFLVDDIAKIHNDDSDAFYDKILRNEGLVRDEDLILNVEVINLTNLNSIREVLLSFIQEKIYIIVEREFADESYEDEFYIGLAKRIEDNDLWFHGYFANGKWDLETGFPLDTITSITFDSPYIKLTSKYIEDW